jgi:hypothetical protein
VLDPGQLAGEGGRDRRGGVGARVVGDDDPPREGELAREEAVQPADALLERACSLNTGRTMSIIYGSVGERGRRPVGAG